MNKLYLHNIQSYAFNMFSVKAVSDSLLTYSAPMSFLEELGKAERNTSTSVFQPSMSCWVIGYQKRLRNGPLCPGIKVGALS